MPSESSFHQEFRENSVHRYDIDLVIEIRNGRRESCSRTATGPRLTTIHSFDNDVHIAVVAADGSHQLLVGLQRVCEGPLGLVAELIEPGRQAMVEHDEELVGKVGGGFAAKSSVQILGGEFVVTLASGAQRSPGPYPGVSCGLESPGELRAEPRQARERAGGAVTMPAGRAEHPGKVHQRRCRNALRASGAKSNVGAFHVGTSRLPLLWSFCGVLCQLNGCLPLLI